MIKSRVLRAALSSICVLGLSSMVYDDFLYHHDTVITTESVSSEQSGPPAPSKGQLYGRSEPLPNVTPHLDLPDTAPRRPKTWVGSDGTVHENRSK